MYRLGTKKTGKNRLIKVIFKTEEDKLKLFNRISSQTLSAIDLKLKYVKLSWDKTPPELKTGQFKESFGAQSQAGDKNVNIIYIYILRESRLL